MDAEIVILHTYEAPRGKGQCPFQIWCEIVHSISDSVMRMKPHETKLFRRVHTLTPNSKWIWPVILNVYYVVL